MEGRISAGEALRDSIKYWSDFISKCLTKRLDAGPFGDYVRLVFSKHQLPPEIIADFFLRPQKTNCVSPDPRIPPYISVLTQLRYVDAASILRALYRYSSLHAQIPTQDQQQHDGGVNGEEGEEETKRDHKRPPLTRWKSSSWLEEVMFYHVIKLVVEGTAFKDSRTALEFVYIISKWMSLFAVASNSMAADMLLQDPQVRHEMEVSRAAFVPLLLRLVDNAALVKVISHPAAKGMADLYTTCISTIHVLTISLQDPGKDSQRASPLLCRLCSLSRNSSRSSKSSEPKCWLRLTRWTRTTRLPMPPWTSCWTLPSAWIALWSRTCQSPTHEPAYTYT